MVGGGEVGSGKASNGLPLSRILTGERSEGTAGTERDEAGLERGAHGAQLLL